MPRSKMYPFWNAPAKLWLLRILFGWEGLWLLLLGGLAIWDAATTNAFTVFKLRPSGSPNQITLHYSIERHFVYWGVLVIYSGICIVVGLCYSLFAYAAMFRAVIPGSSSRKKQSFEDDK